MIKIQLHMDPKAYETKPLSNEIAGIKVRLQKEAKPVRITLKELISKIESGHSISPAVMGGMSAAYWEEQQIFLVDIDNDDNSGPILIPEEALKICRKHNLPPAFYYPTFSYSRDKPKFRLAFIMEEPVTSPEERKIIVDTLISLFPQSDAACKNADRIFLGTNKKAVIRNLNARISMKNVLEAYTPHASSTQAAIQKKQPEIEDETELSKLIRDFDFRAYLAERNGDYKESGNIVSFKNCEICGHKDNLRYYKDTNTYYCFSSSVEAGGSIIDYLMITEGITLGQAINKFKNELCDTEWQTPTPLEEFKLPSFPVEKLPAPLKDWVIAVAENTATPVDMAAVSALAVAAAAVQGKFKIKGGEDYDEPLNLYILLIAKSGERKSSIIRIMTEVIQRYEKEENKRRQEEIDKQEAEIITLKRQIESYEKKQRYEEASQLRAKYSALERKKTKPLRFFADDVTPEALTSLLADNNGVLTIISTEGGLFDMLCGRYSNNKTVSIDTILKAHCGDPIRVDRKGRENETIDHPALTMLLSAQENVLNGLLSNEVFKSRGLTARILYCKPKSKMGNRQFKTPKIPPALQGSYNKLMLELLNIPLPQNGIPVFLELDQDASELVERFFNWLEPQLIGDLDNTSGWAEKFIGTTLRIAGILHCVENGNSSSKVLVTKRTMNRAIKIARYFLRHAKYAYSLMGADRDLQGAKYILKRLSGQPKRNFKQYDIFRLCRGCFSKTEDVSSALSLLMEYGYLKTRANNNPTGGRPNGDTYILNPKYFDN